MDPAIWPCSMLRSLLFNLAFYLATAAFLVLGSPLLLAPRSWAMAGLVAHARCSCWLLQVIVGTNIEIRGREYLPVGAALIASKHQSAWDTFGLLPLLHDPAVVMKAELGWLPLYGWFSHKFGMIFVSRQKRAAALRQLLREARERASAGRQILIFPEGSRMKPGAQPDYKPGVAALYEALSLPCVPLALNSGLFWPRRSFRRFPGTIVVQFLPPIPPGLARKAFLGELQDRIEPAAAALMHETQNK